MGKVGILGGTSLFKSTLFSSLEPQIIETPHGRTIVHTDPTNTRPIVFIQRHHANGDDGSSVYHPPHKINYRANIAAMKMLDVDRVIAICCVGSLSAQLLIGTLVFPDDYFYLFGPPVSLHDDARAHIVPGIDLNLRSQLIDALEGTDIQNLTKDPITYVQTVGPRFETKAEVRFISMLGDVVGMTAATEATLAKEVGLPYAILGMVDNMANGLAGSQLTQENFLANVRANQSTVEKAVSAVLKFLLPS